MFAGTAADSQHIPGGAARSQSHVSKVELIMTLGIDRGKPSRWGETSEVNGTLITLSVGCDPPHQAEDTAAAAVPRLPTSCFKVLHYRSTSIPRCKIQEVIQQWAGVTGTSSSSGLITINQESTDGVTKVRNYKNTLESQLIDPSSIITL